MNYAPTADHRPAEIFRQGGSSTLGSWIRSGLQRLVAATPGPAAARDRVREAAEVRAYAVSMRNSDPGFASDLFAAADRHELMHN